MTVGALVLGMTVVTIMTVVVVVGVLRVFIEGPILTKFTLVMTEKII